MYKVVSSWGNWKTEDMFEFHEDALKKAHERAAKDHFEERTFYVVEIHDAVKPERQDMPTLGVEVNSATQKALFGESDGDAALLSDESTED